MVGELKKGRYVYYHRTEGRGRCDDPYVREEKLLTELAPAVQRLVIAPDTLRWLEASVAESDKTEAGAREQALRQLRSERDRIQARIETMYLDRLDGRTTAEFFDAKSKQWREQQKQIETQMAQLATTATRSSAEAVQIMMSVSQACGVFIDAQPQQQRATVTALLQNATWKAGKFESSWRSPFDKMALSNSVNQREEREKSGSGQKIEIWLPKRNLSLNENGEFSRRGSLSAQSQESFSALLGVLLNGPTDSSQVSYPCYPTDKTRQAAENAGHPDSAPRVTVAGLRLHRRNVKLRQVEHSGARAESSIRQKPSIGAAHRMRLMLLPPPGTAGHSRSPKESVRRHECERGRPQGIRRRLPRLPWSGGARKRAGARPHWRIAETRQRRWRNLPEHPCGDSRHGNAEFRATQHG
jgi:hypothetical protein